MRLIDADALRQGLGMADDCRACSHYKRSCHGCSNELVTDDFCYAIDHAPTIEPEPRWIPCAAELPEQGEMVLVTTQTKKDRRDINRAYYMNGSWHGAGSMAGVVAWMPMPEPWEGGTE